MTYLIWQMLFCLLVAFLLGLLLAWWLGRRKLQERLDRLDQRWRLKLKGCRETLETCRKELEKNGARGEELEECRKELEECRKELEEGGKGGEELEACKAALESCRQDLEAAREAPPAPGDDHATAPMGLLGTEESAEEAVEPDDLKKVEGIGPKIEGLLNAKDILTWAQLAAAEVSFLQSVLDEAGPRYRIHDPATWPQQARLAADGKWDELEELQDRLQGGRES